MTQYTKDVEDQQVMYDAIRWAKGVQSLHSHSLDSMAYAEGRQDGSVCDVTYNDGTIRREIRKTGKIVWFGKKKTTDEIVSAYLRTG